MKPDNFYIISNGPGELAGWVQPLVAEIKSRRSGARIEIFLTPCQFQSGREAEFARDLGVDRVWTVPETLGFCLKGFPAEIRKNSGVVLLLGGDQYYGKKISRRLGWPLFVYTQTRARYARDTSAYFVPSEKIRKNLIMAHKISPEKIVTVGDLVVDAVIDERAPADIKKELGIPPDKFVVTFMPSSRVNTFRLLIPYFLETAALVAAGHEGLEFVYNISDFISEELLDFALAGSVVEKTSADVWLVRGTNWSGKIVRHRVFDVMKISSLLVTIPGTNTLQAAFLGVPMLVALPLIHPAELQFEGLLGLIGNLPLVGVLVKKLAISYLSRKKMFFALPNINAGKYLVPEIVGLIQPRDVSAKILELSFDPARLASMSGELKISSSLKGAAVRIVNFLTGNRSI